MKKCDQKSSTSALLPCQAKTDKAKCVKLARSQTISLLGPASSAPPTADPGIFQLMCFLGVFQACLKKMGFLMTTLQVLVQKGCHGLGIANNQDRAGLPAVEVLFCQAPVDGGQHRLKRTVGSFSKVQGVGITGNDIN